MTDNPKYPHHLPFEQAITHLRPGQWDARVLDQGRVWVDAAAAVHDLPDLTDAHLDNLVTMLRRDARRIAAQHRLVTAGPGPGRPRPTGCTSPSRSLTDAAALRWLAHTALWRALQAELTRRASTSPGTTVELEAAGELWAVRTHHATYLLDLAGSRTQRLPAPGAPRLPSDRTWVRAHLLGPVRLGAPLHLALRRTADRGTTRTTTPVTGIRRLAPTSSEDALLDQAASAWGPPPTTLGVTAYRTVGFLATATGICDYWAALVQVLYRAGVRAPAQLVPRRLRDPDAAPDAADLCLTGPADQRRRDLQADIDDVLDGHLPVTTLTEYPVDPTDHAVPLRPGMTGVAAP